MSFNPFLPPLCSPIFGQEALFVELYLSPEKTASDRAICYLRSALSRHCLLWLILTTSWWISGPWNVLLIILLYYQSCPKFSRSSSREDVAEGMAKSFCLRNDHCKHFALWISILYQANTRLVFRKLVSLVLLTHSLRTQRTPEVINTIVPAAKGL